MKLKKGVNPRSIQRLTLLKLLKERGISRDIIQKTLEPMRNMTDRQKEEKSSKIITMIQSETNDSIIISKAMKILEKDEFNPFSKLNGEESVALDRFMTEEYERRVKNNG